MAKKMPRMNFYGVCDRLGNPGVIVEWGALNGTLKPAQARALAAGLNVASIDAESDAALLLFLVDGGTEPKQAEAIVENVRRKRNAVRLDRAKAAESGDQDSEEEPSNIGQNGS